MVCKVVVTMVTESRCHCKRNCFHEAPLHSGNQPQSRPSHLKTDLSETTSNWIHSMLTKQIQLQLLCRKSDEPEVNGNWTLLYSTLICGLRNHPSINTPT